MTTDILSLPSLLSTTCPGVSRPRPLPGSWRGLDALDRWRRSCREAFRERAFEQRLHRAARRGAPLALGSVASPFDPEAEGAFWDEPCLWRDPAAVVLRVMTRSPSIAARLDLLRRLDRWHAVEIDMLVPCLDPSRARRLEPEAAAPAERLQAVRLLAEHGLTTRLVIPVPTVRAGAVALGRLVEAALEAGARDVVAAPPPGRAWGRRGSSDPFHAALRRLRLRAGLPRALPDRA